MAKKSPGKKKLRVDFSGVESGGGRAVPDGPYTAELTDIEQKEGNESGEPYLACKWKIKSGKAKGAIVYDNMSLQPQALFRLKSLLEINDIEVPNGVMDLDFSDLLGIECEIDITNEDYKGKDKPRITGFSGASKEAEEDAEEEEEEEPEEEEEETEEEEEEETPKKSSKKSTKSEAKLKVGSKVKFKDEDGKTVKGVITSIDGDEAEVEDSKGDEWENISLDELTLQ